ncbi:MAG: 50S ribosomal protein L9 [Planctomycetota bacterium]
MKLLLKKNVTNLGGLGDIVDAAPGYARNYLIPQGFAIEVTKGNLQWFEAQKRRLIAQEEETKAKLQMVADELAGSSCTIIARATEEGHLFGSVTPRDIVGHFAAENIELDPKTIILEKPIKELGIYKVSVRLHPEVEAEVKVWVVKGDGGPATIEEAEAAEAAAAAAEAAAAAPAEEPAAEASAEAEEKPEDENNG